MSTPLVSAAPVSGVDRAVPCAMGSKYQTPRTHGERRNAGTNHTRKGLRASPRSARHKTPDTNVPNYLGCRARPRVDAIHICGARFRGGSRSPLRDRLEIRRDPSKPSRDKPTPTDEPLQSMADHSRGAPCRLPVRSRCSPVGGGEAWVDRRLLLIRSRNASVRSQRILVHSEVFRVASRRFSDHSRESRVRSWSAGGLSRRSLVVRQRLFVRSQACGVRSWTRGLLSCLRRVLS